MLTCYKNSKHLKYLKLPRLFHFLFYSLLSLHLFSLKPSVDSSTPTILSSLLIRFLSINLSLLVNANQNRMGQRSNRMKIAFLFTNILYQNLTPGKNNQFPRFRKGVNRLASLKVRSSKSNKELFCLDISPIQIVYLISRNYEILPPSLPSVRNKSLRLLFYILV